MININSMIYVNWGSVLIKEINKILSLGMIEIICNMWNICIKWVMSVSLVLFVGMRLIIIISVLN